MRGGSVLLLLLSVWVAMSCSQSYNFYQSLMEYLESRFVAIEDRMDVWYEQANRHRAELRDLRTLTSDLIKRLQEEQSTLGEDLTGVGLRIDRAEQELDYLITQNPSRPCVKPEDKMLEKDTWSEEERRGEGEEEEDEEDAWAQLDSIPSDCVDIISNIKSVNILKKMGSPKGMWTRDPRSSKVYVFNGTEEDTLYQFSSLLTFSTSLELNHSRHIQLPTPVHGPGTAIYNGYLYYVREDAGTGLQVVKYDLLHGLVSDSALFPLDGHRAPVYSLNPETRVDLMVDDEALWVLYAPNDWEPNVHLARMDRHSLDIQETWDTRCPREQAEAAFVVCGTLYVVYNTRQPSRSRVQCVFDAGGELASEEAPLLYFPRRYGAHSSLKYNPTQGQLYGWDDGYQILYTLALRRKI